MSAIKFTGEVTLLGPARMRRGDCQRLPLYVPKLWLPEVALDKHGRRRAAILMPGHGKGVAPRSKGLKYPPEPLTSEEVLRLLEVIPLVRPGRAGARGAVWPVGVRNKALITLLWRTGLRISEALALRPHHVDFSGGRVTVLHGKGNKRRTVGIDQGGLRALQPWLVERAMLQVPPSAPLFCVTDGPGRGGLMSAAYVREVLHEYGRRAEIPKRVHPHGFRHTMACDLVREGLPIVNVQAQLGHSNVATTATYLRGMGADEAFDRVAARGWPS